MYYGKSLALNNGPIAGQIELTSSCYQKCAHCMSWRDHESGEERGSLSLEDVLALHHTFLTWPTFEHLSFTGGDPQAWGPLVAFLREYLTRKNPYQLQCNTTLMRRLRPEEQDLWDLAFHDIRLSLDGITTETYRKTRGVSGVDPIGILERCREFKKSKVSVNVCVQPDNIDEIPLLLETIDRNFKFVRKVMLLIVIGDVPLSQEFMDKWTRLSAAAKILDLNVSFSEDPRIVRQELSTPKYADLKCRVGGSTFHIKANGDVYPCCLTGGEAIETSKGFCLGNIHGILPLDVILRKFDRGCHYQQGSVCSKICQWKQFTMNKIAEEASKTRLAMP